MVRSCHRKLKGSSIIVREDLTRINQQLLMSVRNHRLVKSAWSLDGRVYALVSKDGHEYKKRITSPQDLEEL